MSRDLSQFLFSIILSAVSLGLIFNGLKAMSEPCGDYIFSFSMILVSIGCGSFAIWVNSNETTEENNQEENHG